MASSLTVPISAAAHEWAQQFAIEQMDAAKGKQVYLNTLAVWAVQQYLRWLQIDSDLHQSDSWNPAARALFNVADLVLPGLGRLECRPLLPQEDAIALPVPIHPDALGCIAVQFADTLDQVELLGFATAAQLPDTEGMLAIASLQSLDALLDYLSEVEVQAASQAPAPMPLTHLSQWLQRTFEKGWVVAEEILGESRLALAFRKATVRRAKLVHLSPWQDPLGMMVSLIPDDPQHINIQVQICTVAEATHLPPHLQLQILTDTGDVFREVVAGEADSFLQYEFTGQPGEQFSIALDFGQTRVVEGFRV